MTDLNNEIQTEIHSVFRYKGQGTSNSLKHTFYKIKNRNI